MSRGKKLQEMEVDVKESNAVTAGAKPGDKSLPKAGSNAAGVSTPGNSGTWEDLGGPTPENYKSTDDSSKLKTPGASLSQVKNVVNKGAKSAVKSGDVKPSNEEVEIKDDQEVVAEEQRELERQTPIAQTRQEILLGPKARDPMSDKFAWAGLSLETQAQVNTLNGTVSLPSEEIPKTPILAVRTYCSAETALVNLCHYYKYGYRRCNLSTDATMESGVYCDPDIESIIGAIGL